MKAIQIENLSKYYGRARGVENLSLEIEKGEFFGFIGPNGAGKSTTIRAITGLHQATSGSCKVFGMDSWTDKKEVLEKIGYLPSENSYYPGMKVKDIIKLSADLRGMDCREEAERICQALQLDVNKKAAELSFGNKKKLSIVCAMQHKPELLVLDEPTSGLDPLMQKNFFDLLRQRHEAGTTIFLSSHILTEVQNNCERAAIIKNGQIIACDQVENLKQNNVKHVSLVGEAELSSLSGIKNMIQNEAGSSFLYGGKMDALLAVLAKGSIQDITISEPSLDEVFMHYYEEV